MVSTTHPRIDKLVKELQNSGIDAFLACDPISMGYLHGFHEGGGERFLTLAVNSSGKTLMICPALSATQASRSGIADIRSWRDGEDALELFKAVADEWNLRSAIIAVDDEMPAHMLLPMQKILPAALFKTGQEVIAKLMRVKEPQELDLMRKAASIADRAFPAALNAVKPGATEAEVEAALTSEMRKLGGKPTFCIIATGANGAEPHHLSDDTKIQSGDVIVMDFGCSVDGYQSDITRTVCCGKASDKAKKVYTIVYQAQASARSKIKAGSTCESIDHAARKVIDDAGYGDYFMHRTGHGIGMRGHEEPFIVSGNLMELEPGHCFSVEPGIYFPGDFGVRIENIVTATSNGHESFNEEPSETLIEVC